MDLGPIVLVLNYETYKRYFSSFEVKPTEKALTAYGETPTAVMGQVTLPVKYDNLPEIWFTE